MARKVFHSFRYDIDAWRVQQVKKMGVIAGQPLLNSNAWEEVKRGGDPAIKNWIDGQMRGTSCDVVLIGSGTAGRRWVNYEIEKAWTDGKGVVGIYIHRLADRGGNQDSQGRNPFDDSTIGTGWYKRKLSSVVKAYNPPQRSSADVYKHIQDHLVEWVEEAIEIRGGY